MKVLIATDSFKGTFTSLQVAELISKGIKAACRDAEVRMIPMADGGEGTVDAILSALSGKLHMVDVVGPLGDIVRAEYGIADDGTAVIEMSKASGIGLIPKERLNPLLTSTYGTGELILDAVSKGCKKIILGIGGSATNDGGAGFAQAIGVKMYDRHGCLVEGRGGEIGRVERVDIDNIDARIKDVEILLAVDVDNPLCGPRGASAVFGPQKGATPDMVACLDKNLRNYAEKVIQTTGIDNMDVPGMGAAGGLAFSVMQFCPAYVKKGIEIVMDAVDFDKYVQWSDFVITGEGRVDFQTASGKVPAGVAKRAAMYHKPVYAIAGYEGQGAQAVYQSGLNEVVSSVYAPCSLEEALRDSAKNIPRAAERLIRILTPFF